MQQITLSVVEHHTGKRVTLQCKDIWLIMISQEQDVWTINGRPYVFSKSFIQELCVPQEALKETVKQNN